MKKSRVYRIRPFVSLSRRKRREAYIILRGKIRRATSLYGGLFTSHLVLDESRPAFFNQGFSVYFLGSDRFTIWNATITTANSAFWASVWSMAYDRSASLLTPEELKETCKLEYLIKGLSYPKYEKLGGMTFHEHIKKLEMEIVRREPPAVYESFKTDTSYRYGIGLDIVIDAGSINRVTIEETLKRFYAIGEKDWQASEPVPRKNLPFESESEALAKVDYPSVLLGQAVRISGKPKRLRVDKHAR